MKILELLADGNETIELLTVVDYLRRADIKIDMVSTTGSKDLVTSHGVRYQADYLLEEINPEDYDGVYIPGGTKGAETLRDDDRVIEIVKKFEAANKLIAAICAGPIVLDRAGVLADKKATSFPTIKQELKNVGEYMDDEIVVTDGNVTTGRGAAVTNYLALRLIELIKGKEAKEQIKYGTQHAAVENYFDIEF
ncbi:DJ-1 family glyoxalase III [Anaerococcus lactolyticus]|uniref:4-methyl-5(B-hydroxyethyl)-thiazole monophosphate biosynthesis protein n=1 Tax=Anaerococcus lactolyticus S7-1-13 TaxID=1284686 RepID=A0A095X1E8_9FIRM|nr:DJ-1 family glyoxalase III [Anaerococcus lactolyticus]KGF03860.1 4-methyl-5(B-hydroxyethyl)-thiazole monophosphate biosynthesis protein [Anaerococcus lactolyticus S7-1-13]